MAEGNHKPVTVTHLVRGGDLNHHDTLFAGEGALRMVECGFMEAASFLGTNEIVCLRIHGMLFAKPVHKGSMIQIKSKVIYAGKSSLGVYVRTELFPTEEFVVDGYLTFVHTDQSGKALPHDRTLHLEAHLVDLQKQYLTLKAAE